MFSLIPLFIAVLFLVLIAFLIRKDRTRPEPVFPKHTYESVSFSGISSASVRSWSERDVHRLLLHSTSRKSGVYVSKLDPALDSAAVAVVAVYHHILGYSYKPVITSGNDYPWHARNSKHYQNKALDFRIIDVPWEKREIVVREVQNALRGRFRVLWESPGKEGEHLHVEMLR